MIDYENLPQWRKEVYNRRLQKILDSKTRMSDFPESFWCQFRFANKMSVMSTIVNCSEYCEKMAAMFQLPIITMGREMMGLSPYPEPRIPKEVREIAGEALIEAAALGQTKTCGRMLGEGLEANIDAQDSEGCTALYHAIRRKRLGTASYLLDHGARVDIPNKHVLPPVLKACEDGCVPALNMFKHYKIDFNKGYELIERGKNRFSRPTKRILYPLEVAFFFKRTKAVRFLLDNGADVNLFNPSVGKYTVHLLAEEENFLDPETKEILTKKIRENPVSPVNPMTPQKHSLIQRARTLLQR